MADKTRPRVVRWGKKLRRRLDTVIAQSSKVSNDPVLDARQFAWTQLLRDNWRVIRDEAATVLANPDAVPQLARVSPDHRRIAGDGRWRSFFLHGYGNAIAPNLARCPRTAAIVAQVPGLNSAFFSILQPGSHIPRHRGVTKGLLTCHLGLFVPKGRVTMFVHDSFVRWQEGETMVFDDTYQHEVWNDTDETRVVLLIQFARPLRQPGKLVSDLFLWGIRRSPFVREARDNIGAWDQTMKAVEKRHGLEDNVRA